IEPELLDKLLQVGIRAPSSGNLQNYSLLVVDDEGKKAKLAEDTFSPFVKNAPIVIIALIDQYRFYRLSKIHNSPFHYDNADSVFIGAWDAIVALHNIVVAAESAGLGTCYIGLILQADYRELFDLPDYTFAVGMVTIGYPDLEPEQRPRHKLEAILHRNAYTKFTDEQLLDYYDNWLQNWPRFFNKLTDERKAHWRDELGVSNNVQYVAKTVYTEERVKEWGEKITENLHKAKFAVK
nr:hypothetical protein [Asgard group archaeon]